MIRGRLVAVVGACSAALACGGSSSKPCTPGGDGTYVTAPYSNLSQYCMVSIANGQVQVHADVTPYDLNTPLFSDYAVKSRTIWMPAGKSATYNADGVFDFPTGTVFTKSFGFRDDFRKASPNISWVETRVFFKADSGWQGYTYLWNDSHTEATIDYGGKVQPVSWIDAAGAQVSVNYLVPSNAQCKQCHSGNADTTPIITVIGPKAKNLNRDFEYADGTQGQLAHWVAKGMLAGAPADLSTVPKLPVWNDTATGTVEQRARAYLEVNCSHCHSAGGQARTTGLFLAYGETDPAHYGVCKSPVAAGEATGNLKYDLVPGSPDQSIIAYRMAATAPGAAMPQIGRAAVDAEGLALVRSWIAGVTGGPCQ